MAPASGPEQVGEASVGNLTQAPARSLLPPSCLRPQDLKHRWESSSVVCKCPVPPSETAASSTACGHSTLCTSLRLPAPVYAVLHTTGSKARAVCVISQRNGEKGEKHGSKQTTRRTLVYIGELRQEGRALAGNMGIETQIFLGPMCLSECKACKC